MRLIWISWHVAVSHRKEQQEKEEPGINSVAIDPETTFPDQSSLLTWNTCGERAQGLQYRVSVETYQNYMIEQNGVGKRR